MFVDRFHRSAPEWSLITVTWANDGPQRTIGLRKCLLSSNVTQYKKMSCIAQCHDTDQLVEYNLMSPVVIRLIGRVGRSDW